MQDDLTVRTASARNDIDPTTDDRAPRVGRSRLTKWALGPGGLLVIVGCAFGFAQILLFNESRFLEWDEAVYIGKASGRFEPPNWYVHRALGVPWLLKPIFIVSSSFVWMRWYLVFTSTIALCLGFGAWLKPAGQVAPAAMLLFCSSWLTLFYGSEASPNLYVAACVVGAFGMLVRHLESPQVHHLIPAAFGLTLAVLFRPSDGIVAGVGFVLVGLTATAIRRRFELGALAGAAITVGMIPWAVDSWINFGNPVDRWRAASRLVGGGLGWRLDDHLKLLDGPLVGPDKQPGFSAVALLLVFGFCALACLGVIFVGSRRLASIALGIAALMAAPYIFYVAALAPRFLLPAFALLSIAIAFGVAEVAQRWRGPGSLLIGALVVYGLASVLGAESFEQHQFLSRSQTVDVAARVIELAGGRPCTLVSEYRSPELTVATGCAGAGGTKDELACTVTAREDTNRVVIVSLAGWIPPEIEVAIVGDPVPGPDSWVVMQVDPVRALCDR